MKNSNCVIKFFQVIKGFFYFVIGRILFLWKYDAKYLKSQWYGYGKKGRLYFLAPGWKWAVQSYRGNKRNGVNLSAKWPISPRCTVIFPENIHFDPNDMNIFQSTGIYYQAAGEIRIGSRTTIGPNVGLITSNHDLIDVQEHQEPKEIIIGENCWIGMNSVILPGVHLGNNVIVGAGSVVTKSFLDSHIVIAGNPAQLIKRVDCKQQE